MTKRIDLILASKWKPASVGFGFSLMESVRTGDNKGGKESSADLPY